MDVRSVAIFGGSGKLGQRIIDLVHERGVIARVLVHRMPIEKVEDAYTVYGSITDPEAVGMVVEHADVVVSLATMKEDPETFFDVSIRGTFNVLEACRNAAVKQMILFSGDAAQGIWFYPQPWPINEGHALTAYPGYYAFSKVIEETMASQYAIQYDLPITILRSSWVFQNDDLLSHFSLLDNVNPAEPGHGFGRVADDIMQLVEQGQERVAVQVDDNGDPYHRHIVHIDDVMQAFGLMLGNPTALYEDFNIASPAAFEYRVAGDYLSQKTGTPTIEIPCPGYHSFEIDTTKAKSMLGYRPRNDIFTMIDRALQWREQNPRG